MMEIPLLDHGYVKLIETWGSDERIIEAARMSTNKGFQGWGLLPCPGCAGSPIAGAIFIKQHLDDGMGTEVECPSCKGMGEVEGDEKLLRYLYTNHHATPFEMAGLIVEVQAPIFVFREWHRHRTQSYNEMSGRYSVLPNLLYMPSEERLRAAKQSTTNKQGSEGGLTDEEVSNTIYNLQYAYYAARESYEALLGTGVAREIARLVLPVAQFSRMRASANLRNWLAFLTLRMDPAAQWEIRQYANAVHTILTEHFPRTVALFDEKSM